MAPYPIVLGIVQTQEKRTVPERSALRVSIRAEQIIRAGRDCPSHGRLCGFESSSVAKWNESNNNNKQLKFPRRRN